MWKQQAFVTSLHVLHAMSKIWKKDVQKTQENIINRKFSAFDVEYGIYFTRETGSALVTYKKYCLTYEINSIFNIKPLYILCIF